MNNIKESVNKFGYINEKIDSLIDLPKEISKLKKEKNAVILAHFYQRPEIQEIADFVGDSLKLSQLAAETDADIIVFAGVHFMAETAKTLSPEKKVLLPDLNAGCSLADSIQVEDFKKFKEKYPDYTVVSYVNTTSEIKAMSDIVCTSSNALKIIESLGKDEKIIFTPDKNLGGYIKNLTKREDMIVWDGACHVHDGFSLEAFKTLKKQHSDAHLVAHPEAPKEVVLQAEYVGSTAGLLKYVTESNDNEFIVATEEGIIYQMEKANPNKKFYNFSDKCVCGFCEYMKEITLEKLYLSLKYEAPEILLSDELIKAAYKPIKRMLDISAKYNL